MRNMLSLHAAKLTGSDAKASDGELKANPDIISNFL